MKIFHCDHCSQLLFFENSHCISCGHALAYLPDLQCIGSLEPDGGDLWHSPIPLAAGRQYRLCRNYAELNVCNWAVMADDPHPLCQSCRTTLVIPDLSVPGNKEAWFRIESAKRRLVYSLIKLGLPITNRTDDAEHGLAFQFLAADSLHSIPVMTGHDDGVITINLAEANDVKREELKLALDEPYRTLLGHFRHEIGHYYWDQLIRDSAHLEAFRTLFGDEREDYDAALKRHYENGAPGNWQDHYVTAYASVHPWEDWAETWAHYLHMIDTLETAAACGLALMPQRADDPTLELNGNLASHNGNFEKLISDWMPLTYILNNLNRGLGQPDAYPFVLTNAAVEKLRFVHFTIAESATPSAIRAEKNKSLEDANTALAS